MHAIEINDVKIHCLAIRHITFVHETWMKQDVIETRPWILQPLHWALAVCISHTFWQTPSFARIDIEAGISRLQLLGNGKVHSKMWILIVSRVVFCCFRTLISTWLYIDTGTTKCLSCPSGTYTTSTSASGIFIWQINYTVISDWNSSPPFEIQYKAIEYLIAC
jgi:hypothetical protein